MAVNVHQLLGDPFNNDTLAFEAKQADIWTALPAVIQSYDHVKMTCVVQPVVQGVFYKPNAVGVNVANDVNLPLLLDCPVVFPSGGGCTITFPISKGDEVLVIFSSRCIDNWWYLGAFDDQGNTIPRPQAEYRMHDLSDGFVIPGPRSIPRTIPNISTTEIQIRSDDGLASISIHPTTHHITVVAPGNVDLTAPTTTIHGDVHITGDVQVDKTLTATTDVVGGGIHLKTHTHSGVQSGGSNTGAPN